MEDNIIGRVVAIIAISLGVFHILCATLLLIDTIVTVAVDLLCTLPMIFCLYPAKTSNNDEEKIEVKILDWVFILMAVIPSVNIIINYQEILKKVGTYNNIDIVLGTMLIVAVLEATRRMTGVILPGIVIFSLLFAYFGQIFPRAIHNPGFSFTRIISHSYLGMQGLYGPVMITVSRTIFLFVMFGSFLQNTAASTFFTDLAFSLTGRTRGGPAKAAVISSALMGSINGSAVANVATTGTFTIPLMKQVGYTPEQAGAIEAAASTGGQFLPPIMGASAFVMAQLTGIPYKVIALAAALPAILYYFGVFVYVDLMARKLNIKVSEREDIIPVQRVIKENGLYILPLIVIMVMIIQQSTLSRAALIGILTTVIIAFFKGQTNIKWIIRAIEESSKGMMLIFSAAASAGLLLGMVSLTGIGLKLSSLLISFSGGNLLILLFLVAFCGILFGMGLPVVASYITLSVLAAPALVEMGVPLITAHLVVLWYSVTANLTPPVAIAAYAGATLAEGDIMKTAINSALIGIGMYIIPIAMVFGNIVNGNALEVIYSTIVLACAMYAFQLIIVGYSNNKPIILVQAVATISVVLLLIPNILTNVAGIIFLGIALIQSGLISKRLKRG